MGKAVRLWSTFIGALHVAGAIAQTPAPEIISLARDIVDDLAHSRYAAVEARMDARMREALPGPKLRSLWADLVAECGPYQSLGATSTQTRP